MKQEHYLTEEQKRIQALEKQVAKLETELTLERATCRRIDLKRDISAREGGWFIVWHTADGFEILERCSSDPRKYLERCVKERAPDLRAEGMSYQNPPVRQTRMYLREDVQRIRQRGSWQEIVILHYFEQVQR